MNTEPNKPDGSAGTIPERNPPIKTILGVPVELLGDEPLYTLEQCVERIMACEGLVIMKMQTHRGTRCLHTAVDTTAEVLEILNSKESN